jgi:hypothetical protein
VILVKRLYESPSEWRHDGRPRPARTTDPTPGDRADGNDDRDGR